MEERVFHMRMSGTYKDEDNVVEQLQAELEVDGDWQPLELGVTTPGFLIFVYAMFACQHMFFRVGCTQSNLRLASAEGSIRVVTDEDWNMQTLHVAFSGQLAGGEVGQETVETITSGMLQCPVSRNITPPQDTRVNVVLNRP